MASSCCLMGLTRWSWSAAAAAAAAAADQVYDYGNMLLPDGLDQVLWRAVAL
jgi:hypothetical protein